MFALFEAPLFTFRYTLVEPGVVGLGDKGTSDLIFQRRTFELTLQSALNHQSILYTTVTMRPSQIMRSGGGGEIGKYGK